MKKPLAFVLSGGGARGALQVGALRAFLEAGYHPDILVGTSIGAANASILGLKGLNEAGLAVLTKVYQDSAEQSILTPNTLRLALRALIRRPIEESTRRLHEFYVSHGLHPDLRFAELPHAQVLVVATDLTHYTRVIYGLEPDDRVLDAITASTAIPPWIPPIESDGQLLMDGGVVSNLPIEPALAALPKEIIALDVQEYRSIPEDSDGFGPLFNRLFNTIQKRQMELEFAVAAAVRVPVHYIRLFAADPVPVYAFERWEELIQCGYEQARQKIELWPRQKRWWLF